MKCNKLFNVPHVDHIKPRSKYPYLELDGNNLQILCKKCNQDKSDINSHDYRTLEQKEVAKNGFTKQAITIKTIFHERNIIEIGDIENNKIHNNFYSKRKPRRKFSNSK